MTAILVTNKSKNKCIAASERRLSAEDDYTTEPKPKVRKVHGILVGGAGSAAPVEVFMMLEKLAELPHVEDVLWYLTRVIAPAWKIALQESQVLSVTDEIDDADLESEVIVCVKGHCYTLKLLKNGAIHTIEMGLPAGFGCGGMLAIAAYKGLDKYSAIPLKNKMQEALDIVSTLNAACDNNIDIISE